MYFEEGQIYHIYNQGNNRQRIFFERENYLFFLRKMREYLLPHCRILAYCLMPNHFHWMVEVVHTHRMTQSHPMNKPSEATLNSSIAILLRSYTRAINKQQNRTGALFRARTKAECLTKNEGITPSFFNTEFSTKINTHRPEDEYLQVCFDYIHQNPFVAGLVKKVEDWEFSSYKDYAGLRKGTLVDKKRSLELGISFTG